MKCRLYIDEVGNSDLDASTDPNHRYLSLTGVIFDLEYVGQVLEPSPDELKGECFGRDPDERFILHREELINKRPPFDVLLDHEREQHFNRSLLHLLDSLEYVAATVLIDKLEHKERYQVWQADPYHYCMAVLLERYVLWLKGQGATGDVLAEARGKKEDRRLEAAFRELYANGSPYLPATLFQTHLTSKELKVKPKANNIAGLQIADLIAHPSYRACLCRHHNKPVPDNFGGKVAQILIRSKYYRSPHGAIDGWGMKWLPQKKNGPEGPSRRLLPSPSSLLDWLYYTLRGLHLSSAYQALVRAF